MTFEQAALTEPCCVAYNAVVNNARIRPGRSHGRARARADWHSVRRDGPAVRRDGGDRRAWRTIARGSTSRGSTAASRSSAMRPTGREQVDGLGADGVVDATGVSAALTTALDLVRPAGWISKVGWGPQPLGFSLDPLVQKNVTLQGSFSHNWPIWERVIQLDRHRRARRAADHRRRLAAGRVARGVRNDALRADREGGPQAVSDDERRSQ